MICRSWNAEGPDPKIYLGLQGIAQSVAIPCPPMCLPWNHCDIQVKK